MYLIWSIFDVVIVNLKLFEYSGFLMRQTGRVVAKAEALARRMEVEEYLIRNFQLSERCIS